jgi:AcrR family transcriptional regulator
VPTNTGRRSAQETREHLLAVAHNLFYWHGIRATGIDKIAADANVAPTTLYRLFASKDDLIAAYVATNADGYKRWFADATAPALGSPRDRILSLFDALGEQVQPDRCRGCPFLMALAEFPEPGHPARTLAVELKAWVRDQLHQRVEELATDTPIGDRRLLGDQLILLLEGAYATVQAHGADGPARHARRTAETLIDAAVQAAPLTRD